MKKKILTFLTIAFMSLSLSGCGFEEVLTKIDNGPNAFYQIRDRNVEFIEKLNEQGFLTDEAAEQWRNSVITKVDNFVKMASTNQTFLDTKVGDFKNAITDTTRTDHAESKAYMNEDKEMEYGLSEGPLTNIGEHDHDGTQKSWTFYVKQTCDHKDNDNAPECGVEYWAQGDSDSTSFNDIHSNDDQLKDNNTVIAYRLYDDTQVEQLRNALTREIYVISEFDTNNTPEKLQVILAILDKDSKTAVELVENYGLYDTKVGAYKLGELAPNCTNNLEAAQIKALEEALIAYCVPLKDSNGNAVTYLQTEGYSGNQDRYKEENGIEIPYIFADTHEAERESGGRVRIGDDSTIIESNTLGRDLCVTSNGKVSIMFRIMEFNPDLIDILDGQEDALERDKLRGKYYITQQADKYAIRLDYPLYKIESINTDSLASADWYTTISDTGLYMDVKDGYIYDDQHVKMDYEPNLYNTGSSIFWKSDYINPKDTSSQKITMTYQGEQIPIRPLVLKDYVELYAIKDDAGNSIASVTGAASEYWIPIGRRMRVTKLEGDIDDVETFAQSLAFDGSLLDTPNWVSLNEVSDRTSGYGFYEDINERLGLGKENEANIQQAIDAVRSDGDKLKEKTGLTVSSSNFGFALDAMFTYINPVLAMGTEEELGSDGFSYKTPALAQDDHDGVYTKGASGTYGTPTIYGMALSTPVTNANLTGTWLGGNESSCVDITNWNNWLMNNHFLYRVDITKLLEILGIIIDEQNQGESAIIFDKDTLELVSNDLSTKVEETSVRWLRTASRIFGFILTAYGMLLLGAWVFDTNIYAGPKLVSLMTLGRWQAVRDKSDIGDVCGGDDVRFVDLRDMIISLIELTALGVLLWYVDFFDIKSIVEKYVGPLAEKIKDLLIGG